MFLTIMKSITKALETRAAEKQTQRDFAQNRELLKQLQNAWDQGHEILTDGKGRYWVL